MPAKLTYNSYGKSLVRLTKVVRQGPVHHLFEIDADIQLQGDFEAAYTKGDNSKVIATDSIKNTVYVLAKERTFDCIEQFAMAIAQHFVDFYPQVSGSEVNLSQSVWQRIAVDDKPHDHSFTSAGSHKRVVKASASREPAGLQLIGGVRGLQVLKTTGSEWQNFVNDRYRTLRDAPDRILATAIDADWTYNSLNADFNKATAAIDQAILRTFALQYSLGVQQTLLAMGEAALAACSDIDSISFELPNKHRIPFNLSPFDLEFENDVYVATDEPSGLIKGTVTRETA